MADDFDFGDDAPKTNPQDDQLDYGRFAERIVEVVVQLSVPNGYVIGLHGQWGSGKSTILNFVAEYLKQHNDKHPANKIIHIDFRPWIITGHQDLVSSFFKILSENLQPKRRRLKRGLGWITDTTSNLVDAVGKVAVMADPSAGVVSSLAGNVTKKSLDSLTSLLLQEPSLQKAYEDLKEQLAQSRKHFLVTIDDIDRLRNVDIRCVIQMVKSIGQLPNMVYLLCYDRKIVWNALDQDTIHMGPSYAEKIVQQELEIPKPSATRLLEMLDQKIAYLFEGIEPSPRWELIVRDGVHRWIKSPRDVVRLSNAVQFCWLALRDEIDPQDMLAVEGLRLFDPEAFGWLRENRDFLFGEGRFAMAQDEVLKTAVEGLRQTILDHEQSQVVGLVTVLFPQLAKWLGNGVASGIGDLDDAVRRRGIGSEAGYDSYFGLHPSSDAVPLAVVNRLTATTADTPAIEHVLRDYLGKENSRGELMVVKLFEELRIRYRGRKASKPTQAMLDALFRVGEKVIGIERNTGWFDLPPRAHLSFLVYEILKQWEPSEAGEHLVEAFEKTDSPGFLAEVYVSRGGEFGVFRGVSTDPPPITEKNFARLGEILIEKIEQACQDGTLSAAPFYFAIITSWVHLSTPDAPKAWLEEGISRSEEFMAKACLSLVRYTTGSDGRHYEMTGRPDSRVYDLEMFIAAGKKHLNNDCLTKDQRRLITAVVHGSETFLQQDSSPEPTPGPV